jgi:hypothetical protein
MRAAIIISILTIALSGCAEYRARMQAQRDAQAAMQNAAEDTQCRNYGAQPGTPRYYDCRMTLNSMRVQTEQLREAEQEAMRSKRRGRPLTDDQWPMNDFANCEARAACN